MPTGNIAWTRPLPSAAVTATAKKIDGRVISASATRLAAKSNHRPRKTVAMPSGAPSDEADADRLKRGEHRQPGAGHQPAEHVTPEVVGAEQVARCSAPGTARRR